MEEGTGEEECPYRGGMVTLMKRWTGAEACQQNGKLGKRDDDFHQEGMGQRPDHFEEETC